MCTMDPRDNAVRNILIGWRFKHINDEGHKCNRTKSSVIYKWRILNAYGLY